MFDSKADFTKRFALLDIGEEMAYHEGMLATDRTRDKDVHKIGKAAWTIMERGEAHLLQRKLAPHIYEYLIRRKLPTGKVTWPGCYGLSQGLTMTDVVPV